MFFGGRKCRCDSAFFFVVFLFQLCTVQMTGGFEQVEADRNQEGVDHSSFYCFDLLSRNGFFFMVTILRAQCWIKESNSIRLNGICWNTKVASIHNIVANPYQCVSAFAMWQCNWIDFVRFEMRVCVFFNTYSIVVDFFSGIARANMLTWARPCSCSLHIC